MNDDQNMKLKVKLPEEGRNLEAKFITHLRHLNKIEERDSHYPTYKIKFKCEMEPEPVKELKNQIKINDKLLQLKPKLIRGNSEFKEQFEFIRELERQRLKRSNQKLKREIMDLKSDPQLLLASRRSSIFSLKKLKPQTIPMRFANPYPY